MWPAMHRVGSGLLYGIDLLRQVWVVRQEGLMVSPGSLPHISTGAFFVWQAVLSMRLIPVVAIPGIHNKRYGEFNS